MARPPVPRNELALDEIRRYSRHLTLPDVGIDGQMRLREASVLLVGAGGLGAPLAMYLAAAGIGRLGLVEFDQVELSNLQRQLLYGTADVGRSKTRCAEQRIRDINPHVRVECHEDRLCASNARAIFEGYDVVVDGTDNFPTRYLVNDACVLLGKPDVYGSIFRFEGQASVFRAGDGPCYRCLYPEPPAPGEVPNCAEGGVLGILPGVIGSIQATEAIKQILGKGEPLVGRMLLFDALQMRFRELKLRRDPDCPVCGERPTIRELFDEDPTCGVEPADPRHDVGVDWLRERLATGPSPLLLDVRGVREWEICRLDGAELVPMPDLDRLTNGYDRSAEIVVYCHKGIRSARAVRRLRERGFARAFNLVGGIDAWAAEVDPQVPRY
jgi:adenylyltransferase/sulfurtransferase